MSIYRYICVEKSFNYTFKNMQLIHCYEIYDQRKKSVQDLTVAKKVKLKIFKLACKWSTGSENELIDLY